MRRDEQFETFVREHRAALLRSATHVTGGDRHLAEDLLQSALVKTYLAWPTLRSANLPAYVRRSIVNGFIDHQRRSSTRRERPTDDLPDHVRSVTAAAADATTDPTDRLRLGLAQLPTRMRMAVVLRHVEGFSVEETAEILGCATGTVKSQTARGLQQLRTALERLDAQSSSRGRAVHPKDAHQSRDRDTPCAI